MRDVAQLATVLMIITAIAAGALSAVNLVTAPRIAEAKRRAEQEALKKALPRAEEGVFVEIATYTDSVTGKELPVYGGYSSADTSGFAGYAFKVMGKGYSSTIETMVGMNEKGIIEGVEILYQMETPGLGAKIQEKGRYGNRECCWYTQFIGRKAQNLILDRDDPARKTIDSVTGATISSRAVTKSVRRGMSRISEIIESKKLSPEGDDE
jgi:electron transport complex protein RnfG